MQIYNSKTRRADQEGIAIKELCDRYIAEYYKDAQTLGYTVEDTREGQKVRKTV